MGGRSSFCARPIAISACAFMLTPIVFAHRARSSRAARSRTGSWAACQTACSLLTWAALASTLLSLATDGQCTRRDTSRPTTLAVRGACDCGLLRRGGTFSIRSVTVRSEFLAQIMKSRDDIEPLCPDSATEKASCPEIRWQVEHNADSPILSVPLCLA